MVIRGQQRKQKSKVNARSTRGLCSISSPMHWLENAGVFLTDITFLLPSLSACKGTPHIQLHWKKKEIKRSFWAAGRNFALQKWNQVTKWEYVLQNSTPTPKFRTQAISWSHFTCLTYTEEHGAGRQIMLLHWTILKNINYCKTQPCCCRGQVTHPALVRALLPPWSPVFAQHSRAANALQPALPNLNMRKQQASTKEPSFFNSLLLHWGTVETQRELMLPASQGFSMGDQVHPAPPAALGASLLPEDAHHKLQPTVKEASRLAALQWKASCILKTNLRAEKRKLIWQTEIPNVTSVISFWEKYLHCSWTQTKLHQQRFSVCFLMILP